VSIFEIVEKQNIVIIDSIIASITQRAIISIKLAEISDK